MRKGILIEGCDCSGKSTLVRALKSRLFTKGWDVLDVGHRPGRQLDRYLEIYVNADRVILDRGHFSEIVYGDLWRNGEHFADWEKAFLDKYLFDHFVVVRAEAPIPVLVERHLARNYHQIVSKEELQNVQQRFLRLMNYPEIMTYISLNETCLEQIINKILQQLDHDSNRIANRS